MAAILIHTFDPSGTPCFDAEGDQLVGSYFQFVDTNDQPISDLIGPYRDNIAAEKAARRAHSRHEF